jgi:catechol 2,3-dioxygenase-like lactoylglutathione lyase family enzyme
MGQKGQKSMNPHVSTIVLGVEDFARAKQFYCDGLGCPIEREHGRFVLFKLGHGSDLALYRREALAEDVGVAADGAAFRGVTFSHVVDAATHVDQVMAQAKRSGAAIVKPAQSAQWGGYFGYFADPDGHLWKVATAR